MWRAFLLLFAAAEMSDRRKGIPHKITQTSVSKNSYAEHQSNPLPFPLKVKQEPITPDVNQPRFNNAPPLRTEIKEEPITPDVNQPRFSSAPPLFTEIKQEPITPDVNEALSGVKTPAAFPSPHLFKPIDTSVIFVATANFYRACLFTSPGQNLIKSLEGVSKSEILKSKQAATQNFMAFSISNNEKLFKFLEAISLAQGIVEAEISNTKLMVEVRPDDYILAFLEFFRTALKEADEQFSAYHNIFMGSLNFISKSSVGYQFVEESFATTFVSLDHLRLYSEKIDLSLTELAAQSKISPEAWRGRRYIFTPSNILLVVIGTQGPRNVDTIYRNGKAISATLPEQLALVDDDNRKEVLYNYELMEVIVWPQNPKGSYLLYTNRSKHWFVEKMQSLTKISKKNLAQSLSATLNEGNAVVLFYQLVKDGNTEINGSKTSTSSKRSKSISKRMQLSPPNSPPPKRESYPRKADTSAQLLPIKKSPSTDSLTIIDD